MTAARPIGDPGAGEDRALAARLAAGDGAALDWAYRRHGGDCYSLARRILGDDRLAQDVVRDVFLAIWREPGRYDAARGTLGTWLLALTHTRAVETVRREENLHRRGSSARVLEFTDVTEPTGSDEVWVGLRRERVRAVLRALPAAHREAVALAYFGGYTQREIAALTQQPLAAVKAAMVLGVRQLQESLRGLGPSERAPTRDHGAVS